MEVARGRVFPAQTKLCSQPGMEHYAIVHIDYVHSEHEDRPLSLPPSPEVRTLGHALYNKPGRSGYSIFSGQVIRVIQNSGNENCYPILPPKKHYSQIRVPDNSGSGSGITRYTQIYRKQQTTLNFSSDLYIISAAICIEFQ